MPNGATHTIAAALAIGGVASVTADKANDEVIVKTVAGGATAALASKLPDLLEPALHPHHRQFCHSLVFATGLGVAAYKLYKWQPEQQRDEWIRFLLLAGIGGYLLHLAMDACTPRSLPVLGRLPV